MRSRSPRSSRGQPSHSRFQDQSQPQGYGGYKKQSYGGYSDPYGPPTEHKKPYGYSDPYAPAPPAPTEETTEEEVEGETEAPATYEGLFNFNPVSGNL